MAVQEHHFILYKPFGILSQFGSNDARQLRTKQFLGALYDFPEGCMPIGRLDEKSEGLLLITSDGKLSDTINNSGIEKEYFAQLDGEITIEALTKLSAGVEIGFEGLKYVTKPCIAKKLLKIPCLPKPDLSIRLERHRPSSWISITITEGKFRQVRKMTAAVGFPTLRLVRVRIGSITLGNLRKGQVKTLPSIQSIIN
ncbi:pseudouridine synthase [Pareuzebyella sediminis]|uniref:pseudouridine synthase n=1 Tax=Pareuzebyella sediminis TaxID=2607998 RepID=UPI0011ED73E2|nr:pseudouridine synthase [Pareuzebyella sediminis]